MLYQQTVKTILAMAVLFGYCSAFINLSAGPMWSPIPPASILGASATNVNDFFPTVVTTYDQNNQTIVAVWLDVNSIPTYAVWNGTSWIIPATNIPGASALNSFSVPIYSTYNPSNNTIVTTWSDASNNPIYTIWNGTSWTTPTVIPGGSTAGFYSVYTTYDAANQTVVATWSDQSDIPMYAILSGYDWTVSAATIPGGINAETVILSTYNAGNQTVVATWVSNPDVTPVYSVWNGSSWIVPATLIPNGGEVVSVLTVTPTYDAGNQMVLVTWIQSDTNATPTYAILKGTSFTIPATPISSSTTAEAMFFSTYDSANQTVMTTWLDETSTLMYAIWNGSSWTSPTPIPGSVGNSYLLLQPTYDSGSQTIIATWLGLMDMSTILTPVYAVWNGSSWTTPATAIPGASTFSFAGQAPFLYSTYDGANQTVMVTWLDTNGVPTYAVYTNSVATASSFSGYVTNNRFLSQTDRIHNLVWTPSSDLLITGYVLSRNGVPIFSASASGPYCYADHNRKKNVSDVYTLVSQGQNGLTSLPLTVTLK